MTRPEREASGHFDSAPIARQIRLRQEPAGLLDRPRDPVADVALVEQIAPRIDGGLAPEGKVALLLLRERAKRAGELGLTEHAPDGGNRAFRSLQIHARAAGIAPYVLELPGEKAREEFVPGEARRGQLDRRREDVGQRERAKLSEGDGQSVDNSRDGSGRRATPCDLAQLPEVIGRRCRWRDPLAVDDDDLAAVCDIEDDRHLAAKTEMGDLGDRGREHGRHPGVHRIAAAGQHPHPRLGSEVAPSRHDTDTTDDLWSVGRRASDLLSDGHMGKESERRKDGAEDDNLAEGSVCSHCP